MRQRGQVIPALVACFAAGGVTGWVTHARMTRADPPAAQAAPLISDARSLGAESSSPPASAGDSDPIAELRRRRLRLPIDGAKIETMKGEFEERRESGHRGHEAVDIMAPRGTPVHAVDDGSIAKLFSSVRGGTTVYEFDRSGRFCYYYAHLERYADGMREGLALKEGDVVGYVGTSGNAAPNAPHLHFAVFELNAERQWWNGRPLDPYLVFRG